MYKNGNKFGGVCMLKKVIVLSCILLLTLMNVGCSESKKVNSEKFPAKPIVIIVPFSAGGSSDTMIRLMEKTAEKNLGQQIIVVNKPGSGATLGWNELVASNPNGYTVGVTSVSVNLQPIYSATKYHYPTAIDPLVQIATIPVLAVVRSDSPWQTISDVIAYAKEHPGVIKCAHPGVGTVVHVVDEMFVQETGINIGQVPFKGTTEAVSATLGGHVQLLFASPAEVKSLVENGDLRVLAVATEKRLSQPTFANVPTFKEQGLNISFSLWQGIGAPKGLPEDIKQKLVEGFSNIINDPVYKQQMENIGLTVEYLGPEESQNKWIKEKEYLTEFMEKSKFKEKIATQKQ